VPVAGASQKLLYLLKYHSPLFGAKHSPSGTISRDLSSVENFATRAPEHKCRFAVVAAVTSREGDELSSGTKDFVEFMFSSALRKQLGTCAVALTNRIGNFDFLRPRLSAFEEVVYDLWGGPATYMFDRTRAYVRFLSEESHRDSPRHLVFADTDVLFTRSFKEVFDTPFDVGLTFRNMAKYPINNGIMFAHRQRLTEVRCSFSELAARAITMYAHRLSSST